MNKLLFNLAFFTGAIAVIWVGIGFIDSSVLAMAMTALIFVVYLAGAIELHQFRQASTSLTRALAGIPVDAPDLNRFLSAVHSSLQYPVRLRIEGERAGLPGPALTPYLVGLLVMLGMLGTFLGMVVTLKGAVFTLEKTADLETMRSALAVPVKGLGLAFGTSVAGVAASAVLGLMSALCRRERMQAGQLLDTKAATVFHGFSHTRQREQTFRALQSQSEALPQVVDKLQALMTQMEAMSGQLNQRLLDNQDRFHTGAKETYTELARSVDSSLRESLALSAQAAGDSIRPVLEAALQTMAQEAKVMHERTAGTVQQQLDGIADRFRTATASVASTWEAALESQKQANEALADRFDAATASTARNWEAALDGQKQVNQGLADRFGAVTDAVASTWEAAIESQQVVNHELVDRFDAAASTLARNWEASLQVQKEVNHTLVDRFGVATAGLTRNWDAALDRQQEVNHDVVDRLGKATAGLAQTWEAALEGQKEANQTLATDLGRSLDAFNARFDERAGAMVARVGEAHNDLLSAQAAQDEQRRQTLTGSLEAMAETLAREWQESGAQTLAQQRDVFTAVTQAVRELATQVQSDAGASLAATAGLISTAEDLMRSRISAEAQWLDQQRERMDHLAAMLRSELGALREQEAARGDAAVAHLTQLQSAVTTHLTTLGTALEAPIARLIDTAAEAPRAAAEVIGQLRQEMSRSMARDNDLLDERSRIMETLKALLDDISHASQEQRAVIDSLVASSSVKLDAASTEFSANVASEAGKLSEIAAHVTSSAVDVASLAGAFGVAVQSFNDANEKLAANLDRIEVALDKSMTRSDGQLAYYVAQAREIIDLSMSSQKQIVDGLRQLPAMQAEES